MQTPSTTGHGRSGEREVAEASLLCLQALDASVAQYFNQGLQSYEMRDKVMTDLAECKDWNNFNQMGRVINLVYQEVERDNF